MEKSKVYFTKEITESNLVEMYKVLNKELKGKVAVKVHSGEKGNQNYLHPEFMKELIEYVNGTIVECNTAYEGERNTTEKHKKLMDDHKWTKYFNVDIMDSEGPDLELDIPKGIRIKKNYLGKNIKNYDSMLVVSHFKGHPMGGYGGAIKQLSIGCASSCGKAYIHGAGIPEKIWSTEQNKFLESMADAASSVVDYFKGNIIYINIMCNMSVDCDCCAKAEDPCMQDIGILSSTDPIALDQACIDLIYNSTDPGKKHLIERIESRNGIYTIEVSNKLGFGTKEYELINIDKQKNIKTNKYVRVMDGLKSNAGDFEYKIDKVNTSNNWNPTSTEPEKMGGFNFSTEDKILRWIHRGDTIYDVIIPEDAEIILCDEEKGIYRSNKIIVTNPRILNDEMILELYKKNTLSDKIIAQCLQILLWKNKKEISKYIINDRVNKENIDIYIKEYENYNSKDIFKYENLGNDSKEIYDILTKLK